MRNKYTYFLLVLFFFVLRISTAQKKYYFEAGVNGYASTHSQLPFWLRVNQFGAIPQHSPALAATLRAYSKPDSSQRFLDWYYGVEAFGTLNPRSQANIIEGFIGIKVGAFTITAGRKKEVFGLLDTLLSTGSVAWSGNALPIPRVQLATNGFVEIPFTKRLLAFQGSYSHGWVGFQRIHPRYFLGPKDDFNPYLYDYSLDTYLHQKSFYGRFGKPTWKVNLYGGFNHQAFWGNENSLWPQMFFLTRLESYKRVILGQNWQDSKVGNHFGTIDLGASIKGKKWNWFLYRQSIYDTGSLLNAFNLDALNGLSITRKSTSARSLNIQKVVVEYLYTNDQRDPMLDQYSFVGTGNGRNDYFNHYIYLDGWRYRGMVLGTPFAVADSYLKENAGNEDFRSDYIANNRIYALHLATSGSYQSKYLFQLKTSVSRNEGTYGATFIKPRYQWSSFLNLGRQLPWMGGVEVSGKLAVDIGGLYPNNVGIQLSLLKRGTF